MARIDERVKRLQEAHAKLMAKIAAQPNDPKVEAWKARCLEYEGSLQSIQTYGKEIAPTGLGGVKIDVPVSGFTASGHTAEAG